MVMVSQGDATSSRAADLLRRLLAEDEEYRSRWQHYVRRSSPGPLHQGAVSQVLADYLTDIGAMPAEQQSLPRSLKDTVGRALSGRLTPQSLEWFIAAFEISAGHRDLLWRRFAEDQPEAARVADEPAPGRAPAPETAYRTVALDELHVVGADGVPHTHRSVQVIRALEPMTRYSYRFDTSAVAIDVVRGGRPGQVYATDIPGVWAVDIHLHDTVPAGQTAVLEYRTTFRYQDSPPPEFRRGLARTTGAVTLQVQFHPAKVPAQVWFGTWEALDAPPAGLTPQQVGPDHAVHWFGEDVHHALVGFTWQW